MKRLLAKLGLAADASEDSAIEAVTQLKNRADEAATLKNRAEKAEADLETEQAKTRSAEADAFCETHKAVIKNRDSVHAQYMKDPEGTKSLIESLNASEDPAAESVSLKDRATHQPGKKPGEKQQSKAEQLEAKVQEYKGQNRCSYDQAFEAVAKTNPELLEKEQADD